MVAIRTDRRAIEADRDPDGERLAAATAAEYLDVRLRLARALLRIERGGTFHLSGCSSIVQYGVRLGIPAAEARMLVDLGRALDAPGALGETAAVEERVRSGQLPVENAALVGRLLAQPGVVKPGEDWFRKAESLPAPELRKQVNERLEQAAQGVLALVPITVHVTPRTRDGFARARVLASREATVALTEGQTFAVLVNQYLDAADERRRGEGRRRLGPTSEIPGERYVPASVRREVLDRSGDRCEVPGCALGVFLELAHIEAHAEEGSREVENLLRLCSVHHTQLDAELLRFAGWREGRPRFRDLRGTLIALRCAVRAAERPKCDAASVSAGFRHGEGATTQVCERPPPWGETANHPASLGFRGA